MQIVTGNIWSRWGYDDLIVITGNSEVNNKGALIMGTGCAKEAKNQVFRLDDLLGGMVQKMDNPYYGLIVLDGLTNVHGRKQKHFGILQTKYTWSAPSNILLVRRALADLFFFLTSDPTMSVSMVTDGAGYGNLAFDDVLPIMDLFPDTVKVWRK